MIFSSHQPFFALFQEVPNAKGSEHFTDEKHADP
jgi:hypothetical protein